MARRDLIQDTDRPHYYSQYWIDVAQGRQKPSAAAIAAPDTVSPVEEEDEFADEAPILELPKVEARPKPAARTKEPKPEPVRPTLNSLADLANIDLLMKSSAEMGDDQAPDIEAGVGPAFDDSVVTDFDLANATAAEETEEPVAAADEELDDFEDDEEEDDWGGGPRRKKGPTKPAKRREQRRDF